MKALKTQQKKSAFQTINIQPIKKSKIAIAMEKYKGSVEIFDMKAVLK